MTAKEFNVWAEEQINSPLQNLLGDVSTGYIYKPDFIKSIGKFSLDGSPTVVVSYGENNGN